MRKPVKSQRPDQNRNRVGVTPRSTIPQATAKSASPYASAMMIANSGFRSLFRKLVVSADRPSFYFRFDLTSFPFARHGLLSPGAYRG